MTVPKKKFEGHLLLVCLAALFLWHVRKLKGVCCTFIHLLRKKYYFISDELRLDFW